MIRLEQQFIYISKKLKKAIQACKEHKIVLKTQRKEFVIQNKKIKKRSPVGCF